MSNKHQYTQKNNSGIVDNDTASFELISNPGSVTYVMIERLVCSVVEAAQGGGGICEIKDTIGDVIYSFNVDGIKDISFDFGDEGRRVGPNSSVSAVVSGAGSKQAKVSVAIAAHITFKSD